MSPVLSASTELEYADFTVYPAQDNHLKTLLYTSLRIFCFNKLIAAERAALECHQYTAANECRGFPNSFIKSLVVPRMNKIGQRR
jgi:hypothetical protein